VLLSSSFSALFRPLTVRLSRHASVPSSASRPGFRLVRTRSFARRPRWPKGRFEHGPALSREADRRSTGRRRSEAKQRFEGDRGPEGSQWPASAWIRAGSVVGLRALWVRALWACTVRVWTVRACSLWAPAVEREPVGCRSSRCAGLGLELGPGWRSEFGRAESP
jgi:hypothetical protein